MTLILPPPVREQMKRVGKGEELKGGGERQGEQAIDIAKKEGRNPADLFAEWEPSSYQKTLWGEA